MAVFVDLNVTNCTDVKKLQSIIEMAAHLGYSAVAINHVAEFDKKKAEIVKPISTTDLFPSPPTVQGKSTPIKLLTRLTIIASDPSHCNVLRSTSPVTRLYDIVAVYPKTEKLFHAACTSIDVDMICINVTEKYPFFFRRPPINAAIERGIFFEIIYTPAIKDSTIRRYTISNTLSLMEICKGKNIIISSGAEKAVELRGPYDIATLGLLFGLSEQSAKAALSTNCRAALLHGDVSEYIDNWMLPYGEYVQFYSIQAVVALLHGVGTEPFDKTNETRKTAFGIAYTVKKTQAKEDEGEAAEPAFKKAKK